MKTSDKLDELGTALSKAQGEIKDAFLWADEIENNTDLPIIDADKRALKGVR